MQIQGNAQLYNLIQVRPDFILFRSIAQKDEFLVDLQGVQDQKFSKEIGITKNICTSDP